MTEAGGLARALSAAITARTGMAVAGALAARFDALLRRRPTRDAGRLLADAELLVAFIEELRVGETYFFREPEAFAFLRDAALPALIARRGPEHGLKVWCAGCATGEEAYSLAILLDAAGAGRTARVFGTDLSRPALEQARAGVYKAWSFRADHPLLRAPYVERAPGGRAVAPWLRRRVEFQLANLISDPPPLAAFDVIVCRNVLIYFVPDAVERIVAKLAAALAPGGYLIFGAADPVLGGVAGLDTVVTPGGVVFYRPLAATAVALSGSALSGVMGDCRVSVPSGGHSQKHGGPADAASPPPPTGSQKGARKQAVPSDSGRASHEAAASRFARPARDLVADAGAFYGAGDYPRAAATAELAASEAGAELHVRALANIDLRAAELALRRWSRVFPHAPALMDLKAAILLELGRPAEAADVLRALLYLDRSLAVAHLKLGEIMARLGDREGARRAYRNARDLLVASPQDRAPTLAGGEPAAVLAALAESELARLLTST